MFDIWLGDLELTTLTLILSFAVFLPLQLLLCFKVRSRMLRLLPVLLLAGSAAVFCLLSLAAAGWNRMVFLFIGIFAAFTLLFCGIGWGIWAIIRSARRK